MNLEGMKRAISRQSAAVIVPLALVMLLFDQWNWRMPFSVIAGGVISLVSFRVIVWTVTKFLGQEMGQPIIMGISSLKILVIFLLLALLAYFRLVNVPGLVVGFTAVLILIIKEGYLFARRS